MDETVVVKRKSNGDKTTVGPTKCGCKGRCASNMCSCHKHGHLCDPEVCRCKAKNCVNRAAGVGEQSSSDDEFKENPSTKSILPSASRLMRSPQTGVLDVSQVGLGQNVPNHVSDNYVNADMYCIKFHALGLYAQTTR